MGKKVTPNECFQGSEVGGLKDHWALPISNPKGKGSKGLKKGCSMLAKGKKNGSLEILPLNYPSCHKKETTSYTFHGTIHTLSSCDYFCLRKASLINSDTSPTSENNYGVFLWLHSRNLTGHVNMDQKSYTTAIDTKSHPLFFKSITDLVKYAYEMGLTL